MFFSIFSKLFKKDKEKYIISKGIQDVIPIKRIWKDRIFLVGNSLIPFVNKFLKNTELYRLMNTKSNEIF